MTGIAWGSGLRGRGLILRCELGRDGVGRVESIPVRITRCRPEPPAAR